MQIIIPKFRIVDISNGERGVYNQKWGFQLDGCFLSYIGVQSNIFYIFCLILNIVPKIN